MVSNEFAAKEKLEIVLSASVQGEAGGIPPTPPFRPPSPASSVRIFSNRHRQNSEFKFPPKIWSARSAVCSAFPPQNPDSARIRHAPRGSKSTVRASIMGVSQDDIPAQVAKLKTDSAEINNLQEKLGDKVTARNFWKKF
ncbi:MAG: hypothetical protein HYY10_02100 [Candidatus Liptonbacteria bacterium]|nr:hypothetical protein [Candidatus Liptonbacteria bacterium]